MILHRTFWELLKSAYMIDKQIHMCCVFDDFEVAWRGPSKERIKQLAIEYLADTTWNCYFHLGTGIALFDLDETKVFNFGQNPRARSFVLRRAVRSQFIDWVITNKY